MLNIITPCSRIYNLWHIEQSINIPKSKYRWIIVFDKDIIPKVYLPKYAEVYAYHHPDSIVGNSQRNYALNHITHGHIYFNDDDTMIHPDLWVHIEDKLHSHDFISFDQSHKEGTLRLKGNNIKVNHIDSHNFIVSHDICQNSQFHINKYNADGFFATECFQKAKRPLYIPKVLSVYNQLR